MADRKISDLTALTTPAAGDFLPIVDISEAAAASKNKRITIEELMRGVPDGTAAAPGIAFETYPSTGIYSSGANQLAVATNGVGRLFINSTGLVGIGSSAPQENLHLKGAGATSLRLETGNGVSFVSLRQNQTGNYFEISPSAASAQSLVVNRPGGSEALRVDSSGRLLVGTSSTSSICSAVFQGNSQYGFQEGIVFLNRGETGVIGNVLGTINFGNSTGGVFARIAAVADSNPGTNDYPGRLVFSTTADGAASPTEAMRITSAGLVLIGTQTAYSTGATIGGGEVFARNTSARSLTLRRDTTDGTIAEFRRDATTVGTISVTTIATAYNTSSDYRLKENVAAVTDGITRLQQLKPSRFNFVSDPAKTVDGFLAHEAAEIVPECVTGEKDAVDDDGNPIYQGIDQSKLVPLLTAALQEAIAKIETLEARLTAAGIE
jgi:hypothetical protein